MDSLTRFAQAQREIGLAIGEAPATQAAIRRRCSRACRRWWSAPATAPRARGSITAFYTVLTEGDDQQDPIADAARAILDGHVVLSRRIAEAGQYPAIDVEASVSRVMHEIVPPEHAELARRFRQTLSIYQQHRDLISIGAYQKGSDPRIDAAIELWPAMQKFLMQPIEQRVGHADAVQALRQLFAGAATSPKAGA